MAVRPVGASYLQEGSAGNLVRFTAKSGATQTLALSDMATLVELSHTSALALTVPNESSVNFPVGTQIDLLQTGAGQVTLVAAAGVVINSAIGLKLRTQWSSATLIKRASNTWVLIGDLSA